MWQLVEDTSHWAEYGIYTPLQLDWYLQINCLVEMNKDAHGCKHGWHDMPKTDELLRADIDDMQGDIDRLSESMRKDFEDEQREIEAEKQALKSSGSGFTIGEICSL